jgi:mannitol/fructose-specific phosphotransferase system IIA component (Ntr-type)
MDNVESIRQKRISSVLVEWPKVQTLDISANHREVLRRVSERRFSRWPVVRTGEVKPLGYLLAKDLLALADDENWQDRIRLLASISPETTIDQALDRMQADGASIYLVESSVAILGIITMEDILEQVVGKLDDEQAREIPIPLADAVHRGGIVLDLAGHSLHPVIGELAAVISPRHLPPGMDAAFVTARVIEREEEIHTDLGNGVAIPHARIEGLAAPIIVIGRSEEGIAAPAETGGRTRLFFLVLSPLDHPEIQLALLSRIARLVSADACLRALSDASSQVEIEEIIRRNP